MALSSNPRQRRRRYEPQPQERGATLTPLKLDLLHWVAELGIATSAQLSACYDTSPKSARNHLRDLFDLGLVRVIGTSRISLVDPGDAVSPDDYYGSSPNTYILTPAGTRALRRAGLIAEDAHPERSAPRSSHFIAHELAVRDVRVWVTLLSRLDDGHQLDRWEDGASAAIELPQCEPKVARPDAWFVYNFGERVLVGLVEADRGSERGPKRWTEKVAAYQALYASGRLAQVTGYANARVLVFASDARRRDHLAALVGQLAQPDLARRFWFVDLNALSEVTLSSPHWRVPGSTTIQGLLPSSIVTPEGTRR